MPTTSIRYAGPIGQPNFSIALSTAWKSAPSRSSMWKPAKYGNSTRLTKKPGQSFTTTGVLPILLRQLHGRGDGLVGRLLAADHLDQRHHVHRVEEVHADEVLRPLQAFGQAG